MDLPEVEALVTGVGHHGRAQWADIKSLEQNGVAEALELRSAVDLKDKWRNLLRIAMLPVLYKRRGGDGDAARLARQAWLRRMGETQKGEPAAGAAAGNPPRGEWTTTTRQTAEVLSVPASKGARRSKHHSPDLTESKALVDGVESCGLQVDRHQEARPRVPGAPNRHGPQG